MTIRPHPPGDGMTDAGQARFDQAIRARHALAVERLSPQLRAQLAQRRHAALRGTPARTPATWGLRHGIAGLAVVGMLALGLQFRPIVPDAAPVPAIAASSPKAPPNTILDEDPEFYAWLASADARLLAME